MSRFQIKIIEAQETPEEENTIANNDPQEKPTTGYLQDIEIIKIYMTSLNSLKIFWGSLPEDIKLNKTYGVFYDVDTKENLIEPKIKTQDPCLEILNLDYCKRYFFAVAPLNNGTGINPNSSYIRSISTYMDPMAPPLDLQAVFLPATTPCLLIKWTASCRNIPDPVGYKIRLIENFQDGPPTTKTSTTLPSTIFQHSCTVPVSYGALLEISVSNDVPGSTYGAPIHVRVPRFLQPYDVRLAVNASSGAFLLYWREPYVIGCDGGYFYEVLVYETKNVTRGSRAEVFRVNRPGFVFKGNGSEYTFGVDLVCCDYSQRSVVSDLVYGNVNGVIERIVQF
ncbi:uncharacterized protein LOC123683199 isoform X2 [Harmonia axyridis]|uniref:uncharacterized protein LOC123683199 isoform X2 n=1 Tax=Harmonia axyridis TaxID=115357 RepID=UPI001E27537F|nr:uncharacterized protein LOC123683199 isoform X2 [Harmonia axyridis]